MIKSKQRARGRNTNERKRAARNDPDLPKEAALSPVSIPRGKLANHEPKRAARQSEFPVSQRGMNQESQHRKPPPQER